MAQPPSDKALTAEQLDRIALNRRRAQEIRKVKQPAPLKSKPPWGSLAPPQAKRPAMQTDHGSSLHPLATAPSNPQSRQPSLPNPQPTKLLISSLPTPLHSLAQSSTDYKQNKHTANQKSFIGIASSRNAEIHPRSVQTEGPSSSCVPAKSHVSLVQSGRNSGLSSSAKSPVSTIYHPGAQSGIYSGGLSSSRKSAVSLVDRQAQQAQVIKLRDRIKADFVILSRSRFKVAMQYDAGVIEVFKRMKTRAYGKTLTKETQCQSELMCV